MTEEGDHRHLRPKKNGLVYLPRRHEREGGACITSLRSTGNTRGPGQHGFAYTQEAHHFFCFCCGVRRQWHGPRFDFPSLREAGYVLFFYMKRFKAAMNTNYDAMWEDEGRFADHGLYARGPFDSGINYGKRVVQSKYRNTTTKKLVKLRSLHALRLGT